MPTTAEVIARVRTEIGDSGEAFLKTMPGGSNDYDLGVRNIGDAVVRVSTNGVARTLDGSEYALNARVGLLMLNVAPSAADKVTVAGTAYALFGDTELERCVATAVREHCHDRTTNIRYRDTDGFIKYKRDPITLSNLPDVEIDALAILATIEALWIIATDASTDINIDTAEGTHIPRDQRFRQVMHMIDALTARYKTLCQQFNIGLYRIEVMTLRRRDYLTGRYVPTFRTREYDEYGWAVRQLPPIDSPNEDDSGIPSPVYGGYGY